MLIKAKTTSLNYFNKGFTLFELLITLTILSVLLFIGLPGLGKFTASMRADNEISEIHRLLLTARNTAINTGKVTTVCNIGDSGCINDWTGEIKVFANNSNVNALTKYGSTESLITVKSKTNEGDTLTFKRADNKNEHSSIIYTPTGELHSSSFSGSFTFCPAGYSEKGRSLTITKSGRAYPSAKNNKGIEVDRNNATITCS